MTWKSRVAGTVWLPVAHEFDLQKLRFIGVNMSNEVEVPEDSIAIVGLAGQFPGAPSVSEFWQMLCRGRSAKEDYSREELSGLGFPDALLDNPNFVLSGYPMQNVAAFDADYFGYSAREAADMDPQHRLFLQLCVHALEDAGFAAPYSPLVVGVYGGCSFGSYSNRLDATLPLGRYLQDLIGNDKDHLCTRVGYKLGLTGPCVTIQTACSTSLVSIHMACQALLAGDCDVALAGGVTARLPEKFGYFHEPGLSASDGECRSLDAKAQGTVFSGGAGVIVLRRAEDAVLDRNSIRSLIRASSINNDGSLRANYPAPGRLGQTTVIQQALRISGVDPSSIGFVESHGTGTALGDPIEVSALTGAYREYTKRRGYCFLGSLKPNFGHMESAAGVAGVIKATLALETGLVPPNRNFVTASPAANLDESPFIVPTAIAPWPDLGTPRRAAVSSFGMGGTNAHVILEQAPVVTGTRSSRPTQPLILSAKTAEAASELAMALADRCEAGTLELSDAAYTLAVGRGAHLHRVAVAAEDATSAARALRDAAGIPSAKSESDIQVGFLLPGQGSQTVGMGHSLYDSEPVYRGSFDSCADHARRWCDLDIKRLLFQGEGNGYSLTVKDTMVSQLVLFSTEYSLCKLLESWGIVPAATIGHSLGEYVAACISGVMDLSEAIRVVSARGGLMQRLPRGAMVGAHLNVEQATQYLSSRVAIAAINAPKSTVFSGPVQDIEDLCSRLSRDGVAHRSLVVSHAFHSAMMDPILDEFYQVMSKVSLSAPHRPYVSNLTGTWMANGDATDPTYYVKHLREPVQFACGLAAILKQTSCLIEVGPGRTLGTLARMSGSASPEVIQALPVADGSKSEHLGVMQALGSLWTRGSRIDWASVFENEARKRVPLPTYPFRMALHGESRVRAVAANSVLTNTGPALSPASHSAQVSKELTKLPTIDLDVICSMWGEILGSGIQPNDDFFERGGHSMLASELVVKVGQRFGLSVSIEVLFRARTPASFVLELHALRGGTKSVRAAPTYSRDIRLDSEIRTKCGPFQPPKTSLLTGATGFLGAFLLRSLLDRSRTEVVCLIRARSVDDARDRVLRNLQRYGLSNEEVLHRVRFVIGDLGEERLGLDQEGFEKLAGEVDTIFHAGALVNFLYPYSELRRANVVGCQEVYRLAARRVPKPVHLVSTAALFYNEYYCFDEPVPEGDLLLHKEALTTGYLQSKWAAEKLANVARERGIPVTIYRPGTIAGHSVSGAFNDADFIIRMMKSCVQLGMAPEADMIIYMSPVDLVADAIVAGASDASLQNRAYHLVPSQPIHVKDLFEEIRVLGFPLRKVSYEEWHQALQSPEARAQDNALVPFLPFLEAEFGESHPFIDSANTALLLSPQGVQIPVVDRKVLAGYFEYFMNSGFVSRGLRTAAIG